jgi:hypothetical protein
MKSAGKGDGAGVSGFCARVRKIVKGTTPKRIKANEEREGRASQEMRVWTSVNRMRKTQNQGAGNLKKFFIGGF